jgi:hypothetical protein
MFELLGQLFSADSPVFRELKDWSISLSQRALLRWSTTILSGIRCGFSHDCKRNAVGPCVVCQRATCLEHSFVSSDAYVACFHCVKKLSSASAGPQAAAPPPPKEASPKPIDFRKKHLLTLGLKDPVSSDEIRAAFKKLAAKHHPDRHPNRRAAAEKKFKELNSAYQWLNSQSAAA